MALLQPLQQIPLEEGNRHDVPPHRPFGAHAEGRFLALEVPKHETDPKHVIVAWTNSADELSLAILAAVRARENGPLPFVPTQVSGQPQQRVVALWDADRCMHTINAVVGNPARFSCDEAQARSWLEGEC